MDGAAGGGELVQFLEVGDRVRARGSIFGGLDSESVSVETSLRTVLGGIDCDEAVANSFIEYPDEWRDGVLDRRCAVLLLPVVDRAVDNSRGDLGDGQVAERREYS